MKVYRRVGTVWSSAFNLGTGSVSMDSPAAFADVAHNRVYVYWTVYFNSPSRTEVHAAIIDLAAQAYVSDVKIATVNNPNYTNEVTVKAAFFSNGNGILAVHAAGKGQVFLGTTTPASFGQVEPYRPDVAWNSLSFNVGVMSCDQAILAGADGVFTPYIYALTPNQYDGVQGN